MDINEFKEIMLALTDFFSFYKPKSFLSNAQEMYFAIEPELQTWIDNTVSPVALLNGIQLIARIVGNDIIAQLALEQFADETRVSLVKTNYFDNLEDARKWLA